MQTSICQGYWHGKGNIHTCDLWKRSPERTSMENNMSLDNSPLHPQTAHRYLLISSMSILPEVVDFQALRNLQKAPTVFHSANKQQWCVGAKRPERRFMCQRNVGARVRSQVQTLSQSSPWPKRQALWF